MSGSGLHQNLPCIYHLLVKKFDLQVTIPTNPTFQRTVPLFIIKMNDVFFDLALQIVAHGAEYEIAYHYITDNGEKKTDKFNDRNGETQIGRKVTKMIITQTALETEMFLTVKVRVCVEVRKSTPGQTTPPETTPVTTSVTTPRLIKETTPTPTNPPSTTTKGRKLH